MGVDARTRRRAYERDAPIRSRTTPGAYRPSGLYPGDLLHDDAHAKIGVGVSNRALLRRAVALLRGWHRFPRVRRLAVGSRHLAYAPVAPQAEERHVRDARLDAELLGELRPGECAAG